MKHVKLTGAAACLAALSACGGGGGGVVSTPTPTPPPAQTNATLTNLQFSQDFTGNAGYIPYRVNRNTGVAGQRTGATVANGPTRVSYNASTQSYTVTAASGISATFGPGDRESADGTITTYEKTSGARQDNLALFVPGTTNRELVLTYASYGAYQVITDAGSTLDVDTAFFTYGVPTATSDLPRSGTATYNSKIDGQLADATGVYVLGGSSSFQADFAAATVALSMTTVGAHVVTGATRAFGTQSVNGAITNPAGGQPQFAGNGSGGGYNVQLTGQFYGPAAAEIGGTFTMTGANGAVGAGALVGRKN